MDSRSPTPPLRKSALRRNDTVMPEDEDLYEREKEDITKDLDYEDPSVASKKRKRPLTIYEAPLKRRKASSSLLTTQRRNVDNAVKQIEPNATRPYCVVTGASADMTILEYAHVLGVATSDSVLEKLEWAWNMPYYTLNVDTRRNVHPLDIAIHRYFDRTDGNKHNGWFWIPKDEEIILQMQSYTLLPFNRCDPNEFYGDRTIFKYRLIPFPAMKATWSVRKPTGVVTEFNSQIQVEQYHYPFQALPAVSLHVPCHFVICDTGRKLLGFYEGVRPTGGQLGRDFPSLTKPDWIVLLAIWAIYDAWLHVEPSSEWKVKPDDASAGAADDGSHVGLGGPASHGGNEGDGGQGPPRASENKDQPQGGPLPGRVGAGVTDSGDRASALSSLAPEDSASCRDVGEDWEEGGDEAPADEDEEWEDPEYGAWLETWVQGVWEAMQEGVSSPPHPLQKASSSSRSQETVVGVHASEKVTSIGLSETGPMTALM